MSFFHKIKQKVFNELIDVIEWTNHAADTLIWQFPCHQSQIKNGALLTVRETQVAILVDGGQIADLFEPGSYELTTSNMPILKTLRRWKHDFNSSFRVDIYFVNTQPFLNQPWSMANPIMMSDSEFGPIRMRASGSYCFSVEDNPIKFISNVISTGGEFTSNSVKKHLHEFASIKFIDYLVESKIALLDLAANLNEFSYELTIALKSDFSDCGIKLTRFLVEKITLPEAVTEALAEHSVMSIPKNTPTYSQVAKPQNGQPSSEQKDTVQPPELLGYSPQQKAPPPIPPQAIYHVVIKGVQQGCFPMAQLQQMAQQGRLTPDALVWTAGMQNWAEANSIPSLSQLFGGVPPLL